MKHRKVIVSGNVIEVFDYENAPSHNVDKTDDYNALDLDNTQLEPIDRTDSRRKQTVRDARNKTRRLALANFNAEHIFMTLTFAENQRDMDFADNEFKKFVKRLKYHYKLKKLKYLAVREFQNRGAIHYHLLTDLNLDIPEKPVGWGYEKKGKKTYPNSVAKRFDDVYIKPIEKVIASIWRHGFVDIKLLDDKTDNVGAYLIKYMTKNVSKEFFKGRKIYLPSQSLDQPLEFSGYHADLLMESYNLDQKKEVFTNSYESEYLGLITYREFNLNRL